MLSSSQVVEVSEADTENGTNVKSFITQGQRRDQGDRNVRGGRRGAGGRGQDRRGEESTVERKKM